MVIWTIIQKVKRKIKDTEGRQDTRQIKIKNGKYQTNKKLLK